MEHATIWFERWLLFMDNFHHSSRIYWLFSSLLSTKRVQLRSHFTPPLGNILLRCTHREILLIQTKIRLYLPFSDWFEPNRISFGSKNQSENSKIAFSSIERFWEKKKVPFSLMVRGLPKRVSDTRQNYRRNCPNQRGELFSITRGEIFSESC